ncbi:MAG: molecular chaperone DnaK [Planctomycetaceae bacterium]|nr:molecular chaperone DnaK [Planctomycetaceae bacterium]|tara:strand:+ start:691 stop:2568 length:1878 start_codon:yes stop_codon:yes gene_type:complete
MTDKKTPAVGIDLGTTHSVVAFLDNEGRPTTINNSEGGITTPSVVFFDETGPVVGKEAARTAAFEPDLIAQFAKRDIGAESYKKKVAGNDLPPEVVEAIILRKLKEDAELVLGEVKDVVITVPAYFNEPRRKATQDAGELAGLNVLDIINEPTAAAIAYGVLQKFSPSAEAITEKETVLVYDLGGGTFDATLMELEGTKFTAIATAGDVHLGGIDWDNRIFEYVADQFVENFQIDPREDDSAAERLRQSAEVAKMALTARTAYKLHCEYEGNRMRLDLTREEFQELTQDLVERTLFTIRRMLKEASRTWEDITRILLVGGSTRMPMIVEALEAESGVVINRSISPDEAVAHGAAVYADFVLASHNNEETDLLVKNVNSHDLGVLAVEASTGMPRRKILIPKNSTLPATGSGNFKTRDKNQQTIAVNVIEGGDASGRNSTKIGACIVSDLPEDLPAKTAVEVEFKYLENGRLNVNANIPGTDVQATLEIERAAGLSEDKMQYWTNWISDGAILTPVESIASSDAESADSDADIDFTDTEESSDFESAGDESEDDGGGFDFGALADGDSAQDDDQDHDGEPNEFFATDESSHDSDEGFTGLVTDESESEDDVSTDDSDLADFLKDLQ